MSNDDKLLEKGLQAMDTELRHIFDSCEPGDSTEKVKGVIKKALKENPDIRNAFVPRCASCGEPIIVEKIVFDFGDSEPEKGIVNCKVRCHKCDDVLTMYRPKGDDSHMTKTAIIDEKGKAQVSCPYCGKVITFRVYPNNLLATEGGACKHLGDWKHSGMDMTALFAAKGDESIEGERTLGEVLDDLMETDIAGGYDLTHFPKAKGLVAEARVIGEKMQAEINALQGAIGRTQGRRKTAGSDKPT